MNYLICCLNSFINVLGKENNHSCSLNAHLVKRHYPIFLFLAQHNPNDYFTAAAPQLSSFPSTMPPRETEKGNLFFDMDYFSKLMKTPLDESYQKVMPVASVRRMSQPNRVFYTLGLEFPCEIHNMEVSFNFYLF